MELDGITDLSSEELQQVLEMTRALSKESFPGGKRTKAFPPLSEFERLLAEKKEKERRLEMARIRAMFPE